MTRARLALAALAAIAGAFAIAFAWQPGLASIYDDSVSYLIMAQAFSPWSHASDAIAAAWPSQKYPPLFPLWLAVAGGAYDWRIAHAWVALSFAASVFLLGAHARAATGSARLAFAAALVFAWLPGAWLHMKGILTEFPFMALSFGALALHDRFRAAPTLRAAVGVGLLLAAALLTRTIGVALVAAIVAAEALAWWRTRDGARLRLLGWIAGIPTALTLAWYALRPSGGEDAYVAFSASVAQGAAEHGAQWTIDLVARNAIALCDAWYNAILIYWGEPWRVSFLAASFVGLSGLAGLLARAARGRADGLYVAAFVAILAVWPFPGQMYRLALPIVPLLVLHALWLWQRIAARFTGEEAAHAFAPYAAIVPLALCVPAVLFYIAERASVAGEPIALGMRKGDIAEFYRIPDRRAAEANAEQQISVFEDLAQIHDTTPEDARVMWYAPEYVALLSRRRSVPLPQRDLAGIAAQVRATRPDYAYFAAVHPRDSAHRLGNPMDAVAAVLPFATGVWQRVNARGQPEALLLKIDPVRMDAVR